MIDCPQEIPCNPCQFACGTGAIQVPSLTERPQTLPEKCVACANCVAACPGQACFLVDEDFSETEATIEFPFEFLPIPEKGELREARDNEGTTVCMGRVVDILTRKSWQGTMVVRLAVPKALVRQVRGMARTPAENNREDVTCPRKF